MVWSLGSFLENTVISKPMTLAFLAPHHVQSCWEQDTSIVLASTVFLSELGGALSPCTWAHPDAAVHPIHSIKKGGVEHADFITETVDPEY